MDFKFKDFNVIENPEYMQKACEEISKAYVEKLNAFIEEFVALTGPMHTE